MLTLATTKQAFLLNSSRIISNMMHLDALVELLQQAANNVFIGDFIEKATGPGTLNTHAGLEITAEDLADFQAKLQASGNA